MAKPLSTYFAVYSVLPILPSTLQIMYYSSLYTSLHSIIWPCPYPFGSISISDIGSLNMDWTGLDLSKLYLCAWLTSPTVMTASDNPNQNRGSVVLAVTVAHVVASTIFVVLRLISRIGVVRKVSRDDYFIILAWVSRLSRLNPPKPGQLLPYWSDIVDRLWILLLHLLWHLCRAGEASTWCSTRTGEIIENLPICVFCSICVYPGSTFGQLANW